MSEPSPFRPTLVIGLVTAGLISFAAFIVLLGWGGDGGLNSGRATARSAAAIGFKGLVDLADNFFATEVVRDEEALDTYDLLVVPLDANATPENVEQLLRRRSGQATLLILPKWVVVPDPERRGWVRSLGPGAGFGAGQLLGEDYEVAQISSAQAAALDSFDLLEDIRVTLPRFPQTIEGESLSMLVGVPGSGAMVAQLGDQPHYVVADPDLLNNHGLSNPDTASAAIEILARLMPDPDGTIHFDTTLGGAGGGRNMLRSMFEPPFLAMTLALVVAALLAGIHGAARFGPARRAQRAIPFGKAALVENSAGLVRLARREVRLGGGYADVIRDDAGRASAAPANLQGEALEAYLDRFSKAGEPQFSALAHEVRNAQDRGQLIAAARALFRWKKDMIR
jgi:hypothetical protein